MPSCVFFFFLSFLNFSLNNSRPWRIPNCNGTKKFLIHYAASSYKVVKDLSITHNTFKTSLPEGFSSSKKVIPHSCFKPLKNVWKNFQISSMLCSLTAETHRSFPHMAVDLTPLLLSHQKPHALTSETSSTSWPFYLQLSISVRQFE